MHPKHSPEYYRKPQYAPHLDATAIMFGYDRVIVTLRRLKTYGFTIHTEQYDLNNSRVFSWRLGLPSYDHCVVICYYYNDVRDWFTISDLYAPIGEQEIDYDKLQERGAGYYGPAGHYTFDQDDIIEALNEIENSQR